LKAARWPGPDAGLGKAPAGFFSDRDPGPARGRLYFCGSLKIQAGVHFRLHAPNGLVERRRQAIDADGVAIGWFCRSRAC
jgi:hypothetical protein